MLEGIRLWKFGETLRILLVAASHDVFVSFDSRSLSGRLVLSLQSPDHRGHSFFTRLLVHLLQKDARVRNSTMPGKSELQIPCHDSHEVPDSMYKAILTLAASLDSAWHC